MTESTYIQIINTSHAAVTSAACSSAAAAAGRRAAAATGRRAATAAAAIECCCCRYWAQWPTTAVLQFMLLVWSGAPTAGPFDASKLLFRRHSPTIGACLVRMTRTAAFNQQECVALTLAFIKGKNNATKVFALILFYYYYYILTQTIHFSGFFAINCGLPQ